MQPEYGVPQRPKSSFPPWALCIIIPCGCAIPGFAILAAILFPVFAQAREKARQVSCMSNIRIQGTGLNMYAADYDEVLPAAREWMTATEPYVQQQRDYHCPSAGQDPSVYGYAYNSGLSRKPTAKIASPQTTVMNYDSSNLSKDAADAVASLPNPARHNSRRANNIGYADGHAKSKASDSTASGQ